MLNLFNPYEQFSIYPCDDYGDFGGLLSHDLGGSSTARDRAEEQARQTHPSAQPVEQSEKRPDDLRERLAS
jgi:hypothetical protein